MGRGMATNVDSILYEISSLSLEDQEMVDEIGCKRIIEGRWDEIRADYGEALDKGAHGLIKSGSVGDLFGII